MILDAAIAAGERQQYRERNLLALSLLAAESNDLPRIVWDDTLGALTATYPLAYGHIDGRQVSWHIHIDDLTALGITADDIEPAGAVAWDGHTKVEVLDLLTARLRRTLVG
jgi:hypothetical protein